MFLYNYLFIRHYHRCSKEKHSVIIVQQILLEYYLKPKDQKEIKLLR